MLADYTGGSPIQVVVTVINQIGRNRNNSVKGIACANADQLFDALRWNQPRWNGAGFGQIVFRGQGRSNWRLVPNAFRETVVFGYNDEVIKGPEENLKQKGRGE